MVTVSVIVPAYNSAKSIERTIKSVLSQTFSDFELIVINDGSSDETGIVLEKIQMSTGDPRIRLLPSLPNSGVSVSRNRGIREARGDWIAFLDADDTYARTFLETMLANTSDKVDLVVCRHQVKQLDGTLRERGPQHEEAQISGKEAAFLTLEEKMTPFIWDKLFRRDVLGTEPFPLGVHRGEDAVVAIKSCLASRFVRVIPDVLHTYFVSPTSLSWGRVSNLEECDKQFSSITEVCREIAQTKRGQKALSTALCLTYLNACGQAIVQSNGDKEKAISYISKATKRISFKNCLQAISNSIFIGSASVLAKISPSLYYSFYKQYSAKRYSI